MEPGNLFELILQEGRSRTNWQRVVGIGLTILFVALSSLRRSRSKTAAREGTAKDKAQRAYAPIEARGFPVWVWWGFLLATALIYVALWPHFPSLMERVLIAGAALIGLALLRVLGGRADTGRSPAEDLTVQGKESTATAGESKWTRTTHGST